MTAQKLQISLIFNSKKRLLRNLNFQLCVVPEVLAISVVFYNFILRKRGLWLHCLLALTVDPTSEVVCQTYHNFIKIIRMVKHKAAPFKDNLIAGVGFA